MKPTIGIFGLSCSGKTTVATVLASRLDCEVRSCGELIRERAAALGVAVGALPVSEHHIIDAETRRIAEQQQRVVIIDGTFLDNVLAGVENVWLVELNASREERARRYSARQLAGGIAERDEADDLVRYNLYRDEPRRPAAYTVDTTNVSVSIVVTRIEKQWRDA